MEDPGFIAEDDFYPLDLVIKRKHPSFLNLYFKTTKWDVANERYDVVFDVKDLDMHKLFMTFVFWTSMAKDYIWKYFVHQVHCIYKSYPIKFGPPTERGPDPWYWICTPHNILRPNLFQLTSAVLFLAKNLPKDSIEYFNLTHEPLKWFLGANGLYKRRDVFNYNYHGRVHVAAGRRNAASFDIMLKVFNRVATSFLPYLRHIPNVLKHPKVHEEHPISFGVLEYPPSIDFIEREVAESKHRLELFVVVDEDVTVPVDNKSEGLSCAVCMENPIDTRLDPCGHLFCKVCVNKTEICFVCRRIILKREDCFIP